MRITKVNIPKTQPSNDGLEEIKMDRLGQIVLLAGKNGSGKSRILKKIFETLQLKPNKTNYENFKEQLNKFEYNIRDTEDKLKKVNQMSRPPSQKLAAENQKQILERNLEHFKREIERVRPVLNWNKIETDIRNDVYSAKSFVPKNLVLVDSGTLSIKEMETSAAGINIIGVDRLPQGTFAKIQIIQDQWFEATHGLSEDTEEQKTRAIGNYEKLKNLVKIFLNTSLGRMNKQATLFGFQLGDSKLSDGQKILIQLCLALYSQEADLKDIILIMDEPENHLHPSAIIECLDKVKECVPDGQIWIATHSIPLLAHFEPSQIWYVEQGKISYAGRIPELVLEGLLGKEEEINRLREFISLPSQFATSSYAYQCLVEPSVASAKSSDPQAMQIRKNLLELSSTGKIRVLDFGAGKGRILSNLLELEEKNKEGLLNQLDYIAFDEFNNDKFSCEASITSVYGTCEKKYFNSIDSLLANYDRKSFHIVIMCNVLHEIDPAKWLSLFGVNGHIANLLCDDGVLLLIEDQEIPVGEKAYHKGFLVLDTPDLKELFKIGEVDKLFAYDDARGDGRLKSYRIPKECLIRIDESSRIEAIRSIKIKAMNKILKIRGEEPNYKNGIAHGFWTQQLANAQLNLEELTNKS
jgi:predicted ATPase